MSNLSRYAEPLTAEEWERIRQYIDDGPATTYLATLEDRTCIIYAGGAMHPRCYLEIIEDDEEPGGSVDILKHT